MAGLSNAEQSKRTRRALLDAAQEVFTEQGHLAPSQRLLATAFSDPQYIEGDDSFEWGAVESLRRWREMLFVARVTRKSMESAIPHDVYCLFCRPVEGTRQGKTGLVQLRCTTAPETGQRYIVKRYESYKAQADDSWRDTRITPKSVNLDFDSIVLSAADQGELQGVAEFLEVLGENA